MSTETSLEIIKTEEVTSIMATAPDVLVKSQTLLDKATAKAQSLIDTAASGMSDDLDAELNKWQINAKKALTILNTDRTPITQLMTKVAKVFTGMEAKLDPAKPDSFYTKIQNIRNGYAAEKIRIQRQKEAEIQKQQNVKNEKNEIYAKVELSIRNTFNDLLLTTKTQVNNFFEGAKLETFADVSKRLKEMEVVLKIDKWNAFKVQLQAVYLTQEEIENIILNVKTSLFDELAAVYRENMEVIQQEVLDKLPTKKLELEALAKANDEERERLEAERLKRIQEEEDKLKAEAAQANAEDAKKVNSQKEVEAVQNLFDAQAAFADVQAGTNAKEGYNIEVKNYAGWQQIAAFWFQREGKTLSADKFDKKTLGQMKAFAEKSALKDDKERIESNHLVYHEVFKAVTTKP